MGGGDVVLVAVGDLCLGDHLLSIGFGVGSQIRRHGGNYPFVHVAQFLRASDIAFGNLECVSSELELDYANARSKTFRAPLAAIDGLGNTGFRLLSVANNHSMQYGSAAFDETVSRMRSTGIDPLGLRGEPGVGTTPVVIHVRGTTIGFLGYSAAEENFHPGQSRYALWDAAQVQQDVRKLRGEVDFVVVSVHWGIELSDLATPDIACAARAVVDAGADVILGHHAHVFQAVERYRNGLIFYGLGNFVADALWEPATCLTAIVRIQLSRSRDRERVRYELIPAKTGRAYQPVPLSEREQRTFFQRQARINADQQCIAEKPSEWAAYGAASRERLLRIRKVGYLVKNLYRIRSDTWRGLLLEKPRRTGDDIHPSCAQSTPGERQ